MSSGADALVCPECIQSVSATASRDCRECIWIVRRADLGGGTLKSACFSAPWHALGTLLARSRHPSSL